MLLALSKIRDQFYLIIGSVHIVQASPECALHKILTAIGNLTLVVFKSNLTYFVVLIGNLQRSFFLPASFCIAASCHFCCPQAKFFEEDNPRLCYGRAKHRLLLLQLLVVGSQIYLYLLGGQLWIESSIFQFPQNSCRCRCTEFYLLHGCHFSILDQQHE